MSCHFKNSSIPFTQFSVSLYAMYYEQHNAAFAKIIKTKKCCCKFRKVWPQIFHCSVARNHHVKNLHGTKD